MLESAGILRCCDAVLGSDAGIVVALEVWGGDPISPSITSFATAQSQHDKLITYGKQSRACKWRSATSQTLSS